VSSGADERRREAELAVMMAGLLLSADDLRYAPAGGSGRPRWALTLSAAAIESAAVAGEEQRAAFARRDGGTLLVPADLPQTTQPRVRAGSGVGCAAFASGGRSRGDGERC
jgi:hypothetical protein